MAGGAAWTQQGCHQSVAAGIRYRSTRGARTDPVAAAVVAQRRYTASGSAPPLAGASARQVVAAGLLTNLVSALFVAFLGITQRFTVPDTGIQIQDRAAFVAKCGSRGKIHERCCQGLIASWAGHRRTVEGDTLLQIPRPTASRASSGQLQRANGTSVWVGSSQARALTSVTTAAPNTRGRPLRGRSRRPDRPCWQNRVRHLRTVSTTIRSSRAMPASPPESTKTSLRQRLQARAPDLRKPVSRVSADVGVLFARSAA